MNENAIAILGGTGDQGLGLAYRFCQAGRPVVIGSRKLERLDENIGAVAVELTSDDLSEIENAMSQITVVGDRY